MDKRSARVKMGIGSFLGFSFWYVERVLHSFVLRCISAFMVGQYKNVFAMLCAFLLLCGIVGVVLVVVLFVALV